MASCLISLKGNILEGWERKATSSQVPFYVNSTEEITQWDHPDLVRIMENIEEYDTFKYAAYRTALKIRSVQKSLKLHLITLSMVRTALEDQRFSKKSNQTVLSCVEVECFLQELYKVSRRQLVFIEEPAILSQLLLNLLLNIFSLNRENGLLVVQLRIVLTALCAAKLADKYKYLFYHCSTGSSMSRRNLHTLLENLSKIPEAFGEKLSFGAHYVFAATESCIEWSHGKERVTENEFLEWLMQEPQTMVWLSTHYRISVSETVEHFVKCEVCKTMPIVGLRYKCLHCIGYNLCQRCFLCGFSNKSHKLKHPVQEYCQPVSSWEETKSTLLALRNKLFLSKGLKESYLSFGDKKCPLDRTCGSSSTQPAAKMIIPDKTLPNDVPSSKTLTDPVLYQELAGVIERLEEENRQLCNEIDKLHSCSNGDISKCIFKTDCLHKGMLLTRQEVLEDHSHHLELQLHRLKELLQYFKPISCREDTKKEMCAIPPSKIQILNKAEDYLESTPAATAPGKNGAQIVCPQNLSKFIKLQAGLDMLEDVSKGMSENFAPCDTNSKNKCDSASHAVTAKERAQTHVLSDIGNISRVSSELDQHRRKIIDETQYTINDLTPGYSSLSSYTSSKPIYSNDPVDHNSVLELVDNELQIIVEQLEKMFPNSIMADVTNETGLEKKEKVLFVLSEVGAAMKRFTKSPKEDYIDSSRL